jgi:hypothetical protein
VAEDDKKKDRGQTAKRPAEKPGHETAVAPFDDIIDAILDADPEAVREHQIQRRNKRKKPNA